MINETVLFGLLGGVFAEVLGLYTIRQQAAAAFPAYLKSVFYWTVTVLMILAGGALTLVYTHSGIDLKAIVAVNVGASAPLVIASFVRNPPPRID